LQQHIERAFENAIEEHLLGHGWHKGNPDHFDRALALDPAEVVRFIAESQAATWAELKRQHGEGIEKTLIEWLVGALDHQGLLDVIRHGFGFMGKWLRVAAFKPSHGLNPDLVEQYARNRLTVTRQVKFDPASEKSLDIVLSLNGLPIATVELKNPLTAQNVQHAIEQYRTDRDTRLPIFQFKKRALVHFAVDPDLVYMATELRGKDTFFLPFNMGNGTAAGNPEPAPGKYKTSYLWEHVWERDSFLDILGRFIHLQEEEKVVDGRTKTVETMIFPRYHQLDAVRKLEVAARAEGPGHNYLVQHSAGSGKSNSIAWLAYRLAELHRDDTRVFHSVVVVTDRRVLDAQLQKTISQFDHTPGVVQVIDEDSKQLADALEKGVHIIVTTLQKFPVAAQKISTLPDRAYAVIVDEAHSSQGGESAAKLKEVLRTRGIEATTPDEAKLAAAEAETAKEAATQEDDADDVLQKVMESRGRQKNLSFFAFTATPKAKTLEVFGRKDSDGSPRPFHLYSMRQAIEENFIIDVLTNYTTYTTYWKLLKASGDDPKVPKREAAAQLARFVSLHPHNIAQKTEVMVEHFRGRVKHKIGGKAKAMVVTASRLHAVRYRQAFDKYIAEKRYKDVRALVAFSGTVEDPDVPGKSYTEPGMNDGLGEKQLPGAFATDAFNVLLVANKYQTGFDQPLLHTMYVDKRLAGVQAVQTLSRLNRTCRGKEDTFVLDFVNGEEEIRRSFQPYYEQTTVSETADAQNLYKLQHQLEAPQIFFPPEVEAFCKVFYKPKKTQTTADNAEMYRHLDPAVDRFKAKDQETQDEFRVALGAFVRLYAFLSQILPFTDPALEKLYTFGRFLETRLPRDPRKDPLALDAETVLAYYRLDLVREGSIALKAGEDAPVYGPTEAGMKRSEAEEVKLSEIIDLLNERFGTDFKKADQLAIDSVAEELKADEAVQQHAAVNPIDNFALAVKGKIEGAFVDRMDKNADIAARFLNDADFRMVLTDYLVRKVHGDLRTPAAPQP
jgi:type I restriction enzyme, R subunit